jgi:hypothetical protein
MPTDFRSPRFSGDPVLEEILRDPDTGTKKLGPESPEAQWEAAVGSTQSGGVGGLVVAELGHGLKCLGRRVVRP